VHKSFAALYIQFGFYSLLVAIGVLALLVTLWRLFAKPSRATALTHENWLVGRPDRKFRSVHMASLPVRLWYGLHVLSNARSDPFTSFRAVPVFSTLVTEFSDWLLGRVVPVVPGQEANSSFELGGLARRRLA
jgi:hypothetical protein